MFKCFFLPFRWSYMKRHVSVCRVGSVHCMDHGVVDCGGTPLCNDWNMSHSFFRCPSLIDRRGIVPPEDVVHAGPTEIGLPAAKTDINMVGSVSVSGHAPFPISSTLTHPGHSTAWPITCLPLTEHLHLHWMNRRSLVCRLIGMWNAALIKYQYRRLCHCSNR